MDIKQGKNGYYFPDENAPRNGNSKKIYHHFSGETFDDSAKTLSLYEKNMILIEGIFDIFGFDTKKGLLDIKKEVSRDMVSEFYKLIAWLWPPDTNVEQLLPKPSNNLRALYLGNMRPQTVLRSIGRYSLYCDEILVMNPFINPWFVAPEYNPIMHPDDYVSDTWKWVLFIIQIAPFINDKYVILLPNPLDFDRNLRTNIWKQAKERVSSYSEEIMESLYKDNSEFVEDFERVFMSMPECEIRRKFKEFKPSSTTRESDNLIAYIKKRKNNDPYYISNPNEKGAFGFSIYQNGGSLEQGLYISQLTGSYLYTDFEFRWKEILSAKRGEEENYWSPLTYAFQNTDFKYLDGINIKFIHDIKEDGRLLNFRNYLRKTWNTISNDQKGGYKNVNSIAKSFANELEEETKKAEYEWKDIDNELQKWLLGGGGLGSLIIASGIMDWAVAGAGFALAGVNQLLQARYTRKKFRSTTPLSVFIDLKSK